MIKVTKSHVHYVPKFYHTRTYFIFKDKLRHDMPPPRPASGDTIYVMYAYG